MRVFIDSTSRPNMPTRTVAKVQEYTQHSHKVLHYFSSHSIHYESQETNSLTTTFQREFQDCDELLRFFVFHDTFGMRIKG